MKEEEEKASTQVMAEVREQDEGRRKCKKRREGKKGEWREKCLP